MIGFRLMERVEVPFFANIAEFIGFTTLTIAVIVLTFHFWERVSIACNQRVTEL